MGFIACERMLLIQEYVTHHLIHLCNVYYSHPKVAMQPTHIYNKDSIQLRIESY